MNNTTSAMTPAQKPKNSYRITIQALAELNGFENKMDFIEECCNDSVVPACCREGCEVEPDGRCEHGCPSPLVALGVI